MKKYYGLQWQKPDDRDFKYQISAPVVLPPMVDLRDKMPQVYDQGELGSCTANAIAGAFQYEQKKQGIPDFMPSRLFIYYNERVIEKTVNFDSGAMLRDGLKTVVKQGVCSETYWPYFISQFAKKPAPICYKAALKNQVLKYQSVGQNLIDMKTSLAQCYPIILGISVYESFESQQVAKTGIVPMPNTLKEKLLGGHAVLCVGYDEASKVFIMRNSWSNKWGQAGYFTIHYDYLTNPKLASDFWNIQLVEENK